MPKLQRTPAEIEKAKADILDKAVDLMIETGYADFTMRKLADRLSITATTIYNYYKNKDDLFINILIRGFNDLHERLAKARKRLKTPEGQLKSMIAEFTDFGLNNADFYNLMYTWHVPKYDHYAKTDMEPVARKQLESAMKIPAVFLKTIKSYAHDSGKIISDDDAIFLLIHYWSIVHGYIAGVNNTNLNYIHQDPLSLKEKHLDWIAEKFRQDISKFVSQGE